MGKTLWLLAIRLPDPYVRIYIVDRTRSLLEQGFDRARITSQLREEFADSVGEIEKEVEDLLAHLASEGLIGG